MPDVAPGSAEERLGDAETDGDSVPWAELEQRLEPGLILSVSVVIPSYDSADILNLTLQALYMQLQGDRVEAEVRALGDRGAAAQEAGNTALMMAIADTIQRIQMAGCEVR